jgi:hypothetical protein
VKTNGYVCESLGAAAGLVSRFADLSGAAIGNGSSLSGLLTSPSIEGGAVPLSCAKDATAVLGNFLRALARNSSVAGQEAQALLMENLEVGLAGFMLRLLAGAAVGERRVVSAADASTLSVLRTGLGSLLDGKSALLRLPVPSMGGSTTSALVEFKLPASFGAEIFGSNTPAVDVELNSHGFAPASGNRTIVSGLSGLTIALAANGAARAAVSNLSQPVLVTMPLNFPLDPTRPAASQFDCVFWDGAEYSTKGCRVQDVRVDAASTATSVTCACNHLTTFAVSLSNQMPPAGANAASGNMTLTPSTTQSPSSTAAAVLKAAMTISGAFGSISTFSALQGQQSAVRTLLAQSISASLASAIGSGDGISVVVVKMCFDGQCIMFAARRDAGMGSSSSSQMQVEFEVRCAAAASLAAASTGLASDSFRTGVGQQIVAIAKASNLGDWTVVASTPTIISVNTGTGSDGHRPNFKDNSSTVSGGGGAGAHSGDVAGQGDLNLPLTIGIAAGSVVVGLALLVCALRFTRLVRQRQTLKVAPEVVTRDRRKSQVDNVGMIMNQFPHMRPVLPDDLVKEAEAVEMKRSLSLPKCVENVGNKDAADDAGEISAVQQTSVEAFDFLQRLDTPEVIQSRDPGTSSPLQAQAGSAAGAHGPHFESRPPPLEIVESVTSGASTMGPDTPAGVEKAPTEVRLRHARMKLANLQQRLDRFIEESRGPNSASLPGAPEAAPPSPVQQTSVFSLRRSDSGRFQQ